MTPLQRLIDTHRREAMDRAWYAHSEWERKARAEIRAAAESHRRSIGQRLRHIARRLQQEATK